MQVTGYLFVRVRGMRDLQGRLDGAWRDSAFELVDDHLHPCKRLSCRLIEIKHAHIRGHGIKAAGVNDARTRGLGSGVVGVDAAANKGNLAAKVNVIYAMARASGNDVAAIQAIGADHGD